VSVGEAAGRKKRGIARKKMRKRESKGGTERR